MKCVLTIFAALYLALAAPVLAQDSPVVVELFTSQGCSSCPPADKLMQKLAARDDVIALALHVDYWDYIGWKDVYADPENARRQRLYAQASDRRMVYTPQMVINGQEDVIGTHVMELTDLIAEHKAAPQHVRVLATRKGSKVLVQVENIDGTKLDGPLMVQLVRYTPSHEIDITRGENAGKRMKYTNVVDDLSVIGRWNGRTPLKLTARLDDNSPAVVLVQYKGPGAIVAAVRVN
ncbi:MAG: hypothetical protein ACI92Z_003194 [Paracoccaceae bacterium]|jgi:hypothetical protein